MAKPIVIEELDELKLKDNELSSKIDVLNGKALQLKDAFSTTTDANALKDRSIRAIAGNGTNVPDKYGTFVDLNAEVYGGQFFFKRGDFQGYQNPLFYRCYDSDFAPWTRIVTGDEIGTLSERINGMSTNGGNADTLGGKKSSDFVSKAGDTITGSLFVHGGVIKAGRYSSTSNGAAITLDKVGPENFGIGANGSDMQVQYGQVSSIDDGTWSASQNIIHAFKGAVTVNDMNITGEIIKLKEDLKNNGGDFMGKRYEFERLSGNNKSFSYDKGGIAEVSISGGVVGGILTLTIDGVTKYNGSHEFFTKGSVREEIRYIKIPFDKSFSIALSDPQYPFEIRIHYYLNK